MDHYKSFDFLKHRDFYYTAVFVILILGLPYVVFYWMLPIFGDLTIGNDYPIFSIQQQMALQFSLEKGTYPLFVPGFAGGHSSGALTLGQLHHPLRAVASTLPGYWTGGALTANTYVKLFSLGLVHLLAFVFFVRLSIGRVAAFLVSFIAVYNLRMLDMFRYGASLENYTAYIVLCVVVGLCYLHESRWIGAALVAVATYLLCTGGHPQIMYLGLLGAGFCYLVMPFAISAIAPDESLTLVRLKSYYLFGAFGVVMGILMSSAYIFPLYFEFIQANTTRVVNDYNWSLAYSDTWGGTLCSFFRPLHAVVTGAFGGTSLILMFLAFPLLMVGKRRFSLAVFILWGGAMVALIASFGDATPLHYGFWRYFPMASSFRVPGRLTMLMAMPMSLVIAWLYSRVKEDRRWLKIPLGAWMAGVGVLLLVAYEYGLKDVFPPPTHYIPARIGTLPTWVEPRVHELGLIVVVVAGVHHFLRSLQSTRVAVKWVCGTVGFLLMVVLVTQTIISMRYGTWVATAKPTPTFEEFEARQKQSVAFFGNAGFGMESSTVETQIERSILDTDLARFYSDILAVPDNDSAYRRLATDRTAHQAVVEIKSERGRQKVDSISQKNIGNRVELMRNTFNTLELAVLARSGGVLTINYPFSSHWHATVDGQDVPVYRANGYALGIPLPSGEHQVYVYYDSSASKAGITVALLAVSLLLFLSLFRLTPKIWQRAALGGGIVLAAGSVAVGIVRTMSAGENIGTEYQWVSRQLPSLENIAYGKTASANSIHLDQMPYYHYAGRAVDGAIGGRGWYSHKRAREPYWQVDLGTARSVSAVHLHRVSGDAATPRRPMHIQTSMTGKRFTTYKKLTRRPRGVTWKIPMNGEQARFVRLWVRGKGIVGIKEVEVFEE